MKTYKALELYPIKCGKHERMIATEAAMLRVKKFWEVSTMSLSDVAKTLEVSKGTVEHIKQNPVRWLPSMKVYLTLCELSGQELTAMDLNYAYVNVIYPPEEIARRLERLKGKMPISYQILADRLYITRNTVGAVCRYGLTRTSGVYALVMQEISRLEQIFYFDDALRFER